MYPRFLWERLRIQMPVSKWSQVRLKYRNVMDTDDKYCLLCSRCHASSGKCDCKPGWSGIFCDTPCPAGRYGQDCQEKCDCKSGATCNHITGKMKKKYSLSKELRIYFLCILNFARFLNKPRAEKKIYFSYISKEL